MRENKFGFYYSIIIAVIICFALLIPYKLIWPILIAVVFAIYGISKKQLTFSFNIISLIFIALYITYAIYSIFTRHPDWASKSAEYKLSFIIFPLLFSFKSSYHQFKNIVLSGFIFGLLTLLIFCYVQAFSCFSISGDPACMYANNFVYEHHPTYASAFFSFGIAVLWYLYAVKFIFFKNILIPILGTIAFSSAILFCTSLSGFLFILLLAGSTIIYFLFKKLKKIYAFAILAIFPFLLWMVVNYVPQIEGEYNNAKFYADQYVENPTEFVKSRSESMSGSEVRLVMWTAAYNVMIKYPFGVGTGNVDDVLAVELRNLKQSHMIPYEYNPHNQFLQTAIETGILGLLFLVFIVLYGIYLGIKKRNFLLIIVVASLGFNMLFESMLQRQSGIVFYTFMICFLIATDYFTTKKINSAGELSPPEHKVSLESF